MSSASRYLVAALCLAFVSAAAVADDKGFKTIFDGKTLEGWDGRPGFWTVQDGHIRGQTTEEKKAPGNTFLIWRGGELDDFELKISYRILNTSNNSGVQYRSKEVSDWVVSGYQSEVENRVGKTGFLYHEKGRGWLVDVGDLMEIGPDGKKAVVGIVADQPAILAAPYHTDNEWNHYHFICRGNHVIHYLNGYQTVELIDHHVDKDNPDSLKQRRMGGVIAVQIHGGSPMTVDYKDIKLKKLEHGYGEAGLLPAAIAAWHGTTDAGTKGWSTKPLKDPGVTEGRRQTKIEGEIPVLSCDGSGKGFIAPKQGARDRFVFRYQRRAHDKEKAITDGPIKTVLGWETHDVTVTGDGVTVKVNGKVRDGNGPIRNGWIALPSDVAADYRNLVLIPITGK